MRWISAAVTFLLLGSFSVAVVYRTDKNAYLRHVKLLKQYPCEKPQPRVFDSRDIIDKSVLDEWSMRSLKLTIQPPVTILHRCESSGCCQEFNKRCAMAEEEDVTLTFAILGKSLEYHQEIKKNHTRCACMLLEDLPED